MGQGSWQNVTGRTLIVMAIRIKKQHPSPGSHTPLGQGPGEFMSEGPRPHSGHRDQHAFRKTKKSTHIKYPNIQQKHRGDISASRVFLTSSQVNLFSESLPRISPDRVICYMLYVTCHCMIITSEFKHFVTPGGTPPPPVRL